MCAWIIALWKMPPKFFKTQKTLSNWKSKRMKILQVHNFLPFCSTCSWFCLGPTSCCILTPQMSPIQPLALFLPLSFQKQVVLLELKLMALRNLLHQLLYQDSKKEALHRSESLAPEFISVCAVTHGIFSPCFLQDRSFETWRLHSGHQWRIVERSHSVACYSTHAECHRHCHPENHSQSWQRHVPIHFFEPWTYFENNEVKK